MPMIRKLMRELMGSTVVLFRINLREGPFPQREGQSLCKLLLPRDLRAYNRPSRHRDKSHFDLKSKPRARLILAGPAGPARQTAPSHGGLIRPFKVSDSLARLVHRASPAVIHGIVKPCCHKTTHLNNGGPSCWTLPNCNTTPEGWYGHLSEVVALVGAGLT